MLAQYCVQVEKPALFPKQPMRVFAHLPPMQHPGGTQLGSLHLRPHAPQLFGSDEVSPQLAPPVPESPLPPTEPPAPPEALVLLMEVLPLPEPVAPPLPDPVDAAVVGLTHRLDKHVRPSSHVPLPKQAHVSLPAGQSRESPALVPQAGTTTTIANTPVASAIRRWKNWFKLINDPLSVITIFRTYGLVSVQQQRTLPDPDIHGSALSQGSPLLVSGTSRFSHARAVAV
jgi:hypothetical protein